MGKQRRSYTEEFKAEAVRAACAGDRPLTQVARDLGINASLLQGWKQQLKPHAVEHGTGAEPPDEELRRLRRENASLREDREILKKAAAFFAKEHR